MTDDKDEVNIPIQEISPRFELFNGTVLLQETIPDSLALYEIILSLFPLECISSILQQKNSMLRNRKKQNTTSGEVSNFFGALETNTRTRLGYRRELWA